MWPNLTCYPDSDVHPDVKASPLIKLIPIAPAPAFLQTGSRLLVLLFAPLKAIWQAYALYHAMGYKTEPSEWILLQVISSAFSRKNVLKFVESSIHSYICHSIFHGLL
jgi:hypothetical protein